MFQAVLILLFLCKGIVSCISTKSPDGLSSVTTTTPSTTTTTTTTTTSTTTTTTPTTTTTTTTPSNDMCELCPDPYYCDPSTLAGCYNQGTLTPPPTVVRGTNECTYTVTPPLVGGLVYIQVNAGDPYMAFSSGMTTFTCGDYPNNQWKTDTGVTITHVSVAP